MGFISEILSLVLSLKQFQFVDKFSSNYKAKCQNIIWYYKCVKFRKKICHIIHIWPIYQDMKILTFEPRGIVNVLNSGKKISTHFEIKVKEL